MREALRQFIATLAYRGTNVLQKMPTDVATFRPSAEVRTPVEILSHINAVLTYAHARFDEHDLPQPQLLDWNGEVARYFDLLARLDAALASNAPLRGLREEQLLQGPLADAMLHLGQIGIFRRLAGSPVAPESYDMANIRIGHIRTPKELERHS